MAAFIHLAFPATIWPGRCDRCQILYLPIVAGEEDQRVLLDSKLAELISNLADALVHLGDHRNIIFWLLARFVPGNGAINRRIARQHMRGVRGGMSEINEKRAIFVLFDELDGMAREQMGDVAILSKLLVAVIPVGPHPVPFRGVIHVPFEVSDKFIEALVHRMGSRIASQMPLAEKRRGVARFAEQFRNQDFVRRHADARLSLVPDEERIAQAGALLVAAGHQRRARRRASRPVRVEIRHHESLGSELVELRRAGLGSAVEPDIAIAEVVGQDENNVGLLRCLQAQYETAEQRGDRNDWVSHYLWVSVRSVS